MSGQKAAGNVDLTPQRGSATQVGALCIDGLRNHVLLITSRRTKRWIVPKGWPMRDRSPAGAALQEAWEEAGVEGIVGEAELGRYHYIKERSNGRSILVEVRLYPVAVSRLAPAYDEAAQRQRCWFTPAEAAARVDEAELRRLILAFPACREAGLVPILPPRAAPVESN